MNWRRLALIATSACTLLLTLPGLAADAMQVRYVDASQMKHNPNNAYFG